MRVGSLFSGIGGLDLGLERAGMTVAWQSEIDPYASKVLAKHWPHVPNLGDITLIDWSTVERVDLICGGYPCQPFSLAGARAGENDARHLWPYFADAIRHLRPRWALLENVPGHLSMGFGRVLGDLAELGYDTDWDCIPAAAVGAPHLRYRVFVVAHADCDRVRQQPIGVGWSNGTPVTQHNGVAQSVADTASLNVTRTIGSGDRGKRPQEATGDGRCGATVADTACERRSRSIVTWPHMVDYGSQPAHGDARVGGDEEWWAVEPDVGRVAYGVPSRVDRLKCLGNAVVPQVAEYVGRRIMSADDNHGTTQRAVGIADVAVSGTGQQVGDVLGELASGAVGCDGESERVGHLPHNDEPAQDVKQKIGRVL